MTQDIAAAIAVTRFGLGARAGDIERASGNPQAFLRAQIKSGGAPQLGAPAASSSDRLIALREIQRARRTARTAGDAKDPNVQMLAKQLRANIDADFLSRAQLAATTEDGFAERWALFWANHFTVSALKFDTASLIGPFEQEAIRPNVFGRFEDLLLASTRHPAMLLYLDQAQSVGPNSPLARRAGRTVGDRLG